MAGKDDIRECFGCIFLAGRTSLNMATLVFYRSPVLLPAGAQRGSVLDTQ